MHELLSYSIQLYEIIQTALFVYYGFLLVRWWHSRYAIAFFTLTFFFIGLKFHLIPYELGGYLDRTLWGLYNILNIVFIIHFTAHIKK